MKIFSNTSIKLIILTAIFTILFYLYFLYLDIGQVIFNATRNNDGSLDILAVILNSWYFSFSLVILLVAIIIYLIKYFAKNGPLYKKFIAIFIILLELLYTFVVSLYSMSPSFCFYPTKAIDSVYQISNVSEIEFDSNKALYYDKGFDTLSILFPGNGQSASNIIYYLNDSAYLNEANSNFIVVDYPMFGYNYNRLDKKHVYSEAESIIDYSINKLGYTPNNIRIFGFSIGSGIAVYAASKYNVSELVLMAPYDYFTNVMNSYTPVFKGPLSLCNRFDFRPKDLAASINYKVTIYYSEYDTTVKSELSKSLSEAFTNMNLISLDVKYHGMVLKNNIVISNMLNISI